MILARMATTLRKAIKLPKLKVVKSLVFQQEIKLGWIKLVIITNRVRKYQLVF